MSRVMTKIHHINCGTLLVQNIPTVVCHCLILEGETGLTLIDTGIGLLDVQKPVARLGAAANRYGRLSVP